MSVLFILCIPFSTQAQLQVSEDSEVQNCQYLDNVEGSSGYGKKLNWERRAKHSAMSRAEQLGASHLVWIKLNDVGVFNGSAVGKAYNCNL